MLKANVTNWANKAAHVPLLEDLAAVWLYSFLSAQWFKNQVLFNLVTVTDKRASNNHNCLHSHTRERLLEASNIFAARLICSGHCGPSYHLKSGSTIIFFNKMHVNSSLCSFWMCVGPVKTPFTQEEDEWNTILNTNLRGAWLMSKAVGKRMKAAKRGGSIINISSIAGLERSILPGALAYGVSKAGLNHLTKVSPCQFPFLGYVH